MRNHGQHRGRYRIAHPQDHQAEVLAFLQAHAGKVYSPRWLARTLGLARWEVRRAIDLLTYADPRLCEDDRGAVMYMRA
jgi:hypothetical protein